MEEEKIRDCGGGGDADDCGGGAAGVEGMNQGCTFVGSPNPDWGHIRCKHLSACDGDILWRAPGNGRNRCARENEFSSGVLGVVEPDLLFIDDGSVDAGFAVSGSGQSFASATSSISHRRSPAFGGSIFNGMVWQRDAAICDPMGRCLERIFLVVSWLRIHVQSSVRAIVISCTKAPQRRGFFVDRQGANRESICTRWTAGGCPHIHKLSAGEAPALREQSYEH